MLIPDPDLYPTRIPDSTTATKEKRKNLSSYLFCSPKYHKIKNYFIFEQVKTKIWANLQMQKIATKLSKIWVWNPGKNLFRLLNQGSKRHQIPGPDPQHWCHLMMVGVERSNQLTPIHTVLFIKLACRIVSLLKIAERGIEY
jgi:hypothetical protein